MKYVAWVDRVLNAARRLHAQDPETARHVLRDGVDGVIKLLVRDIRKHRERLSGTAEPPRSL